MEKVISLEGPVLKINGQLVLLIPMACGGGELAEDLKGISEVERNFVKIAIPDWLAEMLQIEEGDVMVVGNGESKFHLQPGHVRPVN